MTPRDRARFLVPAAAAVLLGCSAAMTSPAMGPPSTSAAVEPGTALVARPSRFVTKLEADHPLVGKVFDVRGGVLVDDEALLAAAQSSHFVFLGEKHDNPDHHRLQAWVIEALVAAGRRPAVAMEQFDAEVQRDIDASRASFPHDADAIATATRWSESGWRPWEEYAPIVRVVVGAGLPLVAANLSSSRAKSLVRGGENAMAAHERARLGLDRPLEPAAAQALMDELEGVHCGMKMPAKLLEGMAFAERARDATLADRMIAADGDEGVVLVAGTGHTRIDRGVPHALELRGRVDPRVSIAFVEVDAGGAEPSAYAERWFAESLPFDFVMFTPRANDDDPCAGMRPEENGEPHEHP